jgi:hypothetical protein
VAAKNLKGGRLSPLKKPIDLPGDQAATRRWRKGRD